MKSRFIFPLIALILSLTGIISCKKDGPTYSVEGVIWDRSNNQAMGNVTVRVYEQYPGGIEELKFEINSDNSGKYNFALPRAKYQGLVLEYYKDGCFQEKIVKSLSELRTDEVNKIDVCMTYESTIAIHIKNVGSTNQLVRITNSKGKTDCDLCCTQSVRTFQSTNLDTTYYCPNDANFPYEIFYQIGGIASGYETKTAAPGETAVIYIEY